MNNYEVLETAADLEGVPVDTVPFSSSRLKGLYCDGNIALSADLETSADKACILAEELGHHFTTVGVIMDLNDTGNRKQELRARVWAYNKMIGLYGLIRAYKHRCANRYETAEYLGVTEEFLQEAIDYYHSKYGMVCRLDNYVDYFEPFGVLEEICHYD